MAPTLPAHRGFHPIEVEDSQDPLTAIRVLAGFQIALGCLSMVVQGIFTGIILLHMQPDMRHFLISFGIWAGLVFLTTGILGLRLRKAHFGHTPPDLVSRTTKRQYRALATAFLTMNVISAIFASVLFALSVIYLFWLTHRPLFLAPFFVMRHGEIYLYLPCTGLLLATGVLELVLSAVSASLCCSMRFKCCHRHRAGRHRIFTDYPSGTMESSSGTFGPRSRSYSQFSLIPPAALPGQAVNSATHTAPIPNFSGVPPPSYEETWDMISGAANAAATALSERPSATRSNARLYQNLQSSRLSRTSF